MTNGHHSLVPIRIRYCSPDWDQSQGLRLLHPLQRISSGMGTGKEGLEGQALTVWSCKGGEGRGRNPALQEERN